MLLPIYFFISSMKKPHGGLVGFTKSASPSWFASLELFLGEFGWVWAWTGAGAGGIVEFGFISVDAFGFKEYESGSTKTRFSQEEGRIDCFEASLWWSFLLLKIFWFDSTVKYFLFFVAGRRDHINSWHFVAFFVVSIKPQLLKKGYFCPVIADGNNVKNTNLKSIPVQIKQACSQQRE